MSLIKPKITDKKCPICRNPMRHEENGKLGHIWFCNCGYIETLCCTGIWHPENRHAKR